MFSCSCLFSLKTGFKKRSFQHLSKVMIVNWINNSVSSFFSIVSSSKGKHSKIGIIFASEFSKIMTRIYKLYWIDYLPEFKRNASKLEKSDKHWVMRFKFSQIIWWSFRSDKTCGSRFSKYKELLKKSNISFNSSSLTLLFSLFWSW